MDGKQEFQKKRSPKYLGLSLAWSGLGLARFCPDFSEEWMEHAGKWNRQSKHRKQPRLTMIFSNLPLHKHFLCKLSTQISNFFWNQTLSSTTTDSFGIPALRFCCDRYFAEIKIFCKWKAGSRTHFFFISLMSQTKISSSSQICARRNNFCVTRKSSGRKKKKMY